MRKASVSASSSQYVDLSPWSYVLWWFILFSVHSVACAYNAAYAMFYYELHNTYLYACLEYSGIGMLAEDHRVIANVNTVLAAMHGACMLSMVSASVWRRELAYSPLPQSGNSSTKTGRRKSPNKAVANDRVASRLFSARVRTTQLYSRVWGREGVLGVNGNKFHAILVARELLETALQTVQAYRMSWYLPRMLLNRFYLSLLVLNCWSSVVIYTLLFRRNEARRRFACLLCDCILDLISCVGVPVIIFLSYIADYNPGLTGFDMEKWYDDVWSAHALNEFQLVVVVSWSDLASRSIFSFGLVLTTTNLKELLRRAPSKRRIIATADSTRIPDTKPNLKNVGPSLLETLVAHEPSRLIKFGGSYGETGLRMQSSRFMLQVIHILFGLWGVAVLALHIQASVQPSDSQCVLQVRPWAVSHPSCYLAVLDCYRLGIEGRSDEVEAMWSEFDRSSVVTLVMRHCPYLEVPDMLGDFHKTTGIKVYNSTITSWGDSASITNTNHPELIWLYLVRVNLSDGALPAGVQSSDFPAKLYDIEFCYTNLNELPDDLDTKWMIGTSIYIEFSRLTTIPLVLARLNPYYLALTGNPIVEIPPEIFDSPDLFHLGLGNTSITTLPQNVTNLSPMLSFIHFTNTNISFFWSWIDSLVERSLNLEAPLKMGGSAYCADREKIINGETESFTVLPTDNYSPMLMDASEANRDVILQSVDCNMMYSRAFYPIVFEDTHSALVVQ